MKLIHCADLHLDSKMSSNLTKDQARERKNEILRTFSRMVEYADKNQVSGIMICGDMFDTRNVSATARNIVKAEIESHPDIHFFYLKGNHDEDNFISKLEQIPANLHLFKDTWTRYDLGPISISGLELSSDNATVAYPSLVLPHENYNIVMLHGQIAGYATKDKAEIISIDALANKGIDYLALGHVHEMQSARLDRRGVYAYSGCLEGRGFDECGEKGFIELNIDEASLTALFKFVPMAKRTLYELPVDVSTAMNSNEAAKLIEAEINANQYSANSLVKIVLTGDLDVECELNTDYLEDLFSEYFYCVKIKDQTKMQIRYEDYEKDQSLKGEFVRMVMQSDLDDKQKSEVIRCGIQALSGEEI